MSSSTTRTCVLSGTTVTGISPGKCTITSNQAGDTGYLPAPPSTLNLSITTPAAIVAPSPPGISSITSGRGSATLTAPSSNGGAAIVAYAATCSASSLPTKTASGSGLPLTVLSLKGGVAYSCTATAPRPRSPSRRKPAAAA